MRSDKKGEGQSSFSEKDPVDFNHVICSGILTFALPNKRMKNNTTAEVTSIRELIQRFEEKRPEIVFEWKDSETEAEGW